MSSCKSFKKNANPRVGLANYWIVVAYGHLDTTSSLCDNMNVAVTSLRPPTRRAAETVKQSSCTRSHRFNMKITLNIQNVDANVSRQFCCLVFRITSILLRRSCVVRLFSYGVFVFVFVIVFLLFVPRQTCTLPFVFSYACLESRKYSYC